MPLTVSLLDYGAGNVRSVRNAIHTLGYDIVDITQPSQIAEASVIVFPGVGAFGSAMTVLKDKQYDTALKAYLAKNRPFLGICLGMQTLFESSQENQDGDEVIPGLGVVPGKILKFDEAKMKVPHIGWNGCVVHQKSPLLKHLAENNDNPVYFVHSYYAPIVNGENSDWLLTSTTYSGQRFISSIQKGNVCATQFHPEKSGTAGLSLLKGFLEAAEQGILSSTFPLSLDLASAPCTTLVKRIVVALDVRMNDQGDLVVTKGDQYDVREKKNYHTSCDDNVDVTTKAKGGVRNLGKPVMLASRYYREGADEIAFLNITSFRHGVIEDMPMLSVLEEASKTIFVPLTVGGGIRSYTDVDSGRTWSALEVASRYFRAGADKVSLGSDAVHASEDYQSNGRVKSGQSSIEQISRVYGVQAVVVSIDPKRMYAASPNEINSKHACVELDEENAGPKGERFCWYQCTVAGGRQMRDICAVTVAQSVEALGAGEIMLNCIDMDGQGNGFDLPLMRAVANSVSIPVIASSGAGSTDHFSDVFSKTSVEAALAAGIFHRQEVEIEAVKNHMKSNGIPARVRSIPTLSVDEAKRSDI